MNAVSLLVLVATAAGQQATEPQVDTLVRNVTIHDGAGGVPYQGDIAIRGDRIVAVGSLNETKATREIDGRGLIAAPGFIDLHNHSDKPITRARTRLNRNYLTQGVTTILTGNCGGGRGDVEAYFAEIDEAGAGTNVAHLIPQGVIRRMVVGREKRPASPAEIERMQALVDAGMRAGAFGMSTGLIYVPSKYADTSELVKLATVVAQHGGIYVSHMRNENTGLLEAIDELLEIGKAADLPVHVSHFKASGRAAWGLAAEAIRKIEDARSEGQTVTADQYPYTASSTSLGAMVIPDEFRSREKLEQALATPDEKKRLLAAIEKNIQARSGGASLFVAGYAANREWQGKNLAELGQELDRPVLDLILEIQKNGGASMVNFGMSEEEVRLIMQQPFVATASDGGAKVPDETVPHPRSYGTFPRKIGYYAISHQTIPLQQAIRSASGLPADILGIRDRGYLRAGYYADLVLFDPAEFRDTATFQEPHQYARGARYLWVNGRLSIDDGEVQNVLAGRALRR